MTCAIAQCNRCQDSPMGSRGLVTFNDKGAAREVRFGAIVERQAANRNRQLTTLGWPFILIR
jgi:hypothetical protein